MVKSIEDIKIVFSEKQNDEINDMILAFVTEMTKKGQSVSYYMNRRNASAAKAVEDIFLGKKAEFFALRAMCHKFGFPMIKPDLNVRQNYKKGWDIDLDFKSANPEFPNVHVKSCSFRTYDYCGDYSWTFQNENNNGMYGKDELLENNKSELIVFVYIDYPQSNVATIKAVLPSEEVKKYFKDPKKADLRGLKKCVYYQDLLQ